jgi:hypothetical protein
MSKAVKMPCPLVSGGSRWNNAKLTKEKIKIRECLKCEAKFSSHSKYNKLCNLCRKSD